MQDGPTPVEILASIAAYLRKDVMPKLSGSDAFQLRVASNALDLVRRQLAVPPERMGEVGEALARVVGHEGEGDVLLTELALRIADGRIDPFDDEVEALLWSITEAKLEVDQPGYAGLARARALRARTT